MFCFCLGTAVAVLRLSTDSNAALGLVTLFFTNLGVIVAALAAFVKGSANGVKLDSIQGHTDRLINGDMEAKIKAVLRDTVTAENLTPE